MVEFIVIFSVILHWASQVSGQQHLFFVTIFFRIVCDKTKRSACEIRFSLDYCDDGDARRRTRVESVCFVDSHRERRRRLRDNVCALLKFIEGSLSLLKNLNVFCLTPAVNIKKIIWNNFLSLNRSIWKTALCCARYASQTMKTVALIYIYICVRVCVCVSRKNVCRVRCNENDSRKKQLHVATITCCSFTVHDTLYRISAIISAANGCRRWVAAVSLNGRSFFDLLVVLLVKNWHEKSLRPTFARWKRRASTLL